MKSFIECNCLWIQLLKTLWDNRIQAVWIQQAMRTGSWIWNIPHLVFCWSVIMLWNVTYECLYRNVCGTIAICLSWKAFTFVMHCQYHEPWVAMLQMGVLVCRVWPGAAFLGERAHRALEDTVVLRAVVHHCASTLCLTPAVLLCSFVCKSDVNAALAACSFVCLHIVHCCDKYIFLLTQVRASFALNKKTKHKYDIIVLLCCEAFWICAQT